MLKERLLMKFTNPVDQDLGDKSFREIDTEDICFSLGGFQIDLAEQIPGRCTRHVGSHPHSLRGPFRGTANSDRPTDDFGDLIGCDSMANRMNFFASTVSSPEPITWTWYKRLSKIGHNARGRILLNHELLLLFSV